MAFLDALRNPKNRRQYESSQSQQEPVAPQTYDDPDNSSWASEPYFPGEGRPAEAPAATPTAPTAPVAEESSKQKQRRRPGARMSIGQRLENREASASKGSSPYQRSTNGNGAPQTAEEGYDRLLHRAYGGAILSLLGDEFTVLYNYAGEDGTVKYARAERVLWAYYRSWWNGDKSYDAHGVFDLPAFITDLQQAPRTAFRVWSPEPGRADRRKLALAGVESEAVLALHDSMLGDIAERVAQWLEEHPQKAQVFNDQGQQPPKAVGFGLPQREVPKQETPAIPEDMAQFMVEFMKQFTQAAQTTQAAAPAQATQAQTTAPAPAPAPTQSAAPADPANPVNLADPINPDASANSAPATGSEAQAQTDASANSAPVLATGAHVTQEMVERLRSSTSGPSAETVVRALGQGNSQQQQ